MDVPLIMSTSHLYSFFFSDTMTVDCKGHTRGLLLWLDPHRTTLWHFRQAVNGHFSLLLRMSITLEMALRVIPLLLMVLLAALSQCSTRLTPRISFPQGECMVNVNGLECPFLFHKRESHNLDMLASVYFPIYTVYNTSKKQLQQRLEEAQAIEASPNMNCIFYNANIEIIWIPHHNGKRRQLGPLYSFYQNKSSKGATWFMVFIEPDNSTMTRYLTENIFSNAYFKLLIMRCYTKRFRCPGLWVNNEDGIQGFLHITVSTIRSLIPCPTLMDIGVDFRQSNVIQQYGD